MTTPAEGLSSTRHLVVVLRLVVAGDGRITHGEVLDPCRLTPQRFVGLAHLGDALQRCVDGALRGSPARPGTAQSDPERSEGHQ